MKSAIDSHTSVANPEKILKGIDARQKKSNRGERNAFASVLTLELHSSH